VCDLFYLYIPVSAYYETADFEKAAK